MWQIFRIQQCCQFSYFPVKSGLLQNRKKLFNLALFSIQKISILLSSRFDFSLFPRTVVRRVSFSLLLRMIPTYHTYVPILSFPSVLPVWATQLISVQQLNLALFYQLVSSSNLASLPALRGVNPLYTYVSILLSNLAFLI